MSRKKIAEYGDDKFAVKVYKDSEWGEYVARLYINGKLYEPADAFDSDKESIIDTAISMLRHATTKKVSHNPRDIHIDIDSHNERETVVKGGKNPKVQPLRTYSRNHLAINIRRPNDVNGNPHSMTLILKADENGGQIVGANVYSYGEPKLLKHFGLKSIIFAVDVTPKEFNSWKRLMKNLLGSKGYYVEGS